PVNRNQPAPMLLARYTFCPVEFPNNCTAGKELRSPYVSSGYWLSGTNVLHRNSLLLMEAVATPFRENASLAQPSKLQFSRVSGAVVVRSIPNRPSLSFPS